MSTALGVSADQDNNGCTPLDHRMIIGSNYLNCGIKNGLGVKGRSDLRYQVDAGVAVTSRGDADGKMEAYFEGGATPETTAKVIAPRNTLYAFLYCPLAFLAETCLATASGIL